MRRGVDGVLVQPSLPLADRRRRLAVKQPAGGRVLSASSRVAGGLMSLGADQADICPHGGGYVDRVLKGAKPRTCRCSRPTKFELVVNQKTARALGLTLSPMFLARADEVIE